MLFFGFDSCSWEKAVGESIEKPLLYYQNNLDATFVLLAAMRNYGINRIVFSSSATVYGDKNVSPLVETMGSLAPTNPYGRTKLFIEDILRDECIANKRFQAVLLRYFNRAFSLCCVRFLDGCSQTLQPLVRIRLV